MTRTVWGTRSRALCLKAGGKNPGPHACAVMAGGPDGDGYGCPPGSGPVFISARAASPAMGVTIHAGRFAAS